MFRGTPCMCIAKVSNIKCLTLFSKKIPLNLEEIIVKPFSKNIDELLQNFSEKRSLYHFTDSGAPSTRGSKSNVEDDRISSTSYNRADFKAALYTEPSNETGTCI